MKLPALCVLIMLALGAVARAEDAETFSLELTGAIEGKMDQGNSYGKVQTVTEYMPVSHTLNFIGKKPLKRNVALTFNGAKPAPGTYKITADSGEGTVNGLVVDSTEKTRPFANSTGTVTLDAAGETLSGNFEMTVSDNDGGKITVKGTFANIK